jgi:hypothetical protein
MQIGGKRYSKSSCEYGVGKKLFKTTNLKRHLSILLHLKMGYKNYNLKLFNI